VENINDIWGWITMGLTAGLLVPGFLRLYWWRFNGSGFATGTFAGIVGAVVQRGLYPELDERWQFVLLLGVGLAGAVAGTYLAPPTRRDVLETFYRATRPMGFWRPFLRALPEEAQRDAKREHRRDLLGVPFAVVWQVTLFLLPMQVIIKAWSSFFVTLAVCGVALAGLVVFWLRHQREDPETKAQPVVDVSAP
jgi:hypothetical protein